VEALKKRSLPRSAVAAMYVVGVFAFAILVGSGVMRCPFAVLTHHPCPGCGSTRAVRALLSFDFAGAMRLNPIAPLVALFTGIIAVDAFFLILREGHVRDLAVRGPGAWALRALLVCLVLEIPVWALRFFGLFGGPVAV
jgi:Protein of unknown function (DUF2752)